MPTTTRGAFAAKRAAAKGQCAVDVGFWGGVVPGNVDELEGLIEDGVLGFKCFLVDSGVPEFPPLDGAGLREAFAAVDALFIVHAEDPARLHDARSSRTYADFLASRPAAAEVSAVDTALDRSVALGYGNLGLALRRRLPGWPADPPRMDGEVVLVTGAGSGLGLAADHPEQPDADLPHAQGAGRAEPAEGLKANCARSRSSSWGTRSRRSC